jgi:hypothetical protein
MNRSLVLILGAVFMIGGVLSAEASPWSPPRGVDDTVYVAEADPVVVVYEAELDTLVVRAEGKAKAPVAATQDPAPAPAAEASAAPNEPRTASTTASTTTTSSEAQGARAARQTRPASSGGASSGVKEGISVAGLIIDRTHSVIGRDFKDAFHNHWTKPEDASSFTILIAERPLPQFGSQIRVSVGETAVYQGQLRPGYRQIEKAAQRAAARARYYLREFYEPREVY